ncbi:MAG: cyclopropane-fatty-acyl-phospholipid synthase family protein [Vicinamibacterales bacterium]
MSTQPLPEPAAYYDRLSRWNRLARWIGYAGGSRSLTVHRALADPDTGRSSTTRLHDLIVEALPPLNGPRVLDAGCGLGGTLIDFAKRLGATGIGVTLSQAQAVIARQAIARAGLADRVRVVVHSYDDPPGGPFDLIVAIESLAHAPAPEASVATLASRLAPGGVFAVVDDMPTDASAAKEPQDLAVFRQGWGCPVLLTAAQYRSAFARCGLRLEADCDLTSAVSPRPLWRIAWLERLNRAAVRLLPSAGLRMVLDSHHGGLALERLYRQNRIEYRLLIARRDPVSSGA